MNKKSTTEYGKICPVCEKFKLTKHTINGPRDNMTTSVDKCHECGYTRHMFETFTDKGIDVLIKEFEPYAKS